MFLLFGIISSLEAGATSSVDSYASLCLGASRSLNLPKQPGPSNVKNMLIRKGRSHSCLRERCLE